MKKMLLLAACALCAVLLAAPAMAEKKGTCGSDVTWTLSDDGVLTVSGNGAVADMYAFPKSEVKEAVFEEGITALCGLMLDRSPVKKVHLPSTLTEIPPYAFAYCVELETVNFPDGLTSIGNWAFYMCSHLRNVALPDSVEFVSARAFYAPHCTTRYIDVPDSVKMIGLDAFKRATIICSKGSTAEKWAKENGQSVIYRDGMVRLAEGVRCVEAEAFLNCTGITAVVVPPSVTEIGDRAFPRGVTIICKENSTAYYWAQKNGCGVRTWQ